MKREPLRVALALGALYLIWGSTYLAIRIGLEGLPPLLMAGTRFLAAGGVLLAMLRLRGTPLPTAAQWRDGAVVGLFLCGANGLVTFAEQDVSSNLAAVVVASVPLWTVAFAALGGERPSRPELLGLLIGLAGVVLLNAGGELSAKPLGAALLVLSTWSWAGGSAWSRRRSLAPGLMAAATQMLPGGLVLVVLGLARGERILALPPARPAAAWAYLTVLGSLVGFSAYNYLLRAVRPSVATSYAYVNPAVAVALGAAAGEPVGPRAVGALALILAGVAVLARAAARPGAAAGTGRGRG